MGTRRRSAPASDDAARRAWLSGQMEGLSARLADRIRPELIATYGPDRGGSIRRVEAFEAGEHGSPLDAAARARLFPFVPGAGG